MWDKIYVCVVDSVSIADIVYLIVFSGVATWAVVRWQRWNAIRHLKVVLPITPERQKFQLMCSQVSIVSGSEPSTFRKYVHSNEAFAIARLLQDLPKTFEVGFDGFFGTHPEDGNVLCLGSGAYNEKSQDFFLPVDPKKPKEQKVMNFGKYEYVSGPGHHEFIRVGGKTEPLYRCDDPLSPGLAAGAGWLTPYSASASAKAPEIPKVHRVSTDFGVIVRKRIHGDAFGLLLCGFHSHGTLAAATVAMSKSFQARVLRSGLREYAQIVKCEVRDDGQRIKEAELVDGLIPLQQEIPLMRRLWNFLAGRWSH